jgi:hypothetical protein
MTTLREAFGPDVHRFVDAIRIEYLGKRVIEGNKTADLLTSDQERRALMEARLHLYRDRFRKEIENIIDQLYTHNTVKEERRRFVDLVGFLNVPKRITDEVASLYDVPTKRSFRDDKLTTAFAKVEREVQLHSVMKEAHRLCFWLNEVLLWHVRREGKRSLRIITPNNFSVIPHPKDRLEVLAVLIDAAPAWVPNFVPDRRRLVHHELWDSELVVRLDADGMVVNIETHGLGRIPGVLMHSRLPVEALLNADVGGDIYAAARTVLFLNLLVVVVSQSSGEKLPLLKGNLAAMAANQPKAAGMPINLPPGVEAEMLDAITSPEHFLTVCRHVVASVAQSYGMSYEQFTFQETADTASGKAWSVRREKLNELREEGRQRAQVHEGEVADLLGFPGEDMRPDFHEQAVPTDPLEEMELFEKRMNRGLDDPIQYLMRKNVDWTYDEAKAHLEKSVSVSMWFFALLRSANLSMNATPANPGQPPQENGAQGGASSSPPAKKKDMSWVREEVRRVAA